MISIILLLKVLQILHSQKLLPDELILQSLLVSIDVYNPNFLLQQVILHPKPYEEHHERLRHLFECNLLLGGGFPPIQMN